MADDVRRRIAAVWRIEASRIVAGLARRTGDVALAEDAAQDALEAALRQWPGSGVPDNPAAWLTATAQRRAIDEIRRAAAGRRAQEAIALDLEESVDMPDPDDDFGDDVLRLVFVACHPILPREARVALTLRMVGGLTTPEIARAFLTSEATVAQRIVRAKRALTEAGVAFELPPPADRPARLESVLEVIYLVFNEGYSASSGDSWTRPELCEDALRLGRVLANLLPDEPEAHGLVALMELQASRLRARTGPDGRPVLLLDQDRSRWDQVLIGRGLAALERADRLEGHGGFYVLQAELAACHARARRAEDTDWVRIANLYAELFGRTGSPVVELNRAVAVGMADGPGAGLAIADRLLQEPALRSYHLLPSVRGDLLAKLGRTEEARAEFERAAALAGNGAERDLLLTRAAECAASD